MSLPKSTTKGMMPAVRSSIRSGSVARPLELVLGDASPSAAANEGTEKLRRMVQDLKMMDAAWREPRSSPPNAAEQSLYVLIRGRVCSDIFLFHREKNSRLVDMYEDEVQLIDREVKDSGGCSFGVTLTGDNSKIIDEEEDKDDPQYALRTNDKLADCWHEVELLIELLEKSRNSIQGRPILAKAEVILSTVIGTDGGEAGAKEVECVKTREQILKDILRGLAERRQERRYAPPVGEELKCYREIRKWATSTISYIQAESTWLESSDRPWGDAETCLALEKLRRRSTDWECICAVADSTVLFQVPRGHRIAMVFDESPELQWLLSVWKERLSDITTRFHGMGKKSTDVANFSDDINTEAQGQQGWEVEKKRKRNIYPLYTARFARRFKPAATGSDKLLKKTRAQYLSDILLSFESMGSLCSDSLLSLQEVRLYALIQEHVSSNIWLFQARATTGDMHNYGKNDDLAPFILSAPESGRREQKTRVDYLQEIVRLVEELESVFVCSPPTSKEMRLYEEISKHINVGFMQSSCHKKQETEGITCSGSVEYNEEQAAALAEHMLKAVCVREIELAAGLEKQFGDALWSIFNLAPKETHVTKWLMEHKEEAVQELQKQASESGAGAEFLDRVLLSLHEGVAIVGYLLWELMRANEIGHFSLYEWKQYKIPLMEAWVVLRGEMPI